ncbi:P-loop NTPase fold protein [Microbulbifer sp. ZKSA004]|uniref:P-loop NTPase fold protein n=1 Tax=Microbulbifer sp. ZKSA004 TaxID=3243389 RepID=UPI0040391A95
MSSIENIKCAVKAYLDRAETPYSIMIDGDWGVGKTHLFKEEILPTIDRKGSIYISLFGLETIQEIESEIFKAMSFVGDSEDGFIKGLLNSNAQTVDEVRVGGVGYVVQFALKKWKSSRLNKSKSLILCFDDIERWKGDIEVCLSYINKLVEHEGGKCIIIGALDQIEDGSNKGIFNAKEKTIRHIYRLEKSPAEVIHASLRLVSFGGEGSERYIKQLVGDNESRIVSVLKESNYRNIRVVSDSLQLFDYIYCKNESVFNLSRTSAISYYCCLLSVLILFRKYILDNETQRKIISHGDEQSFGLLRELGYFIEEDDPKCIGLPSKYLLGEIFHKEPEIKLEGIFGIVEKGFYCEEDFLNSFISWRESQTYEVYIDAFKYMHMDDSKGEEVFYTAFSEVFEGRAIKNPITLLVFADRIASDVARGVLDFDYFDIKDKIRHLFDQLYSEGVMEKIPSFKDRSQSERFKFSEDLYEYACELHERYISDSDTAFNGDFWTLIKEAPQDSSDLFEKYRYKPVFTFYEDPKDVIDALEMLNNGELFELTRMLGSRLSDPNCTDAVNLESQKSKDLVEAICSKYGRVFSLRSSHFKQISRVLKNRDVKYDFE